MCTFKEYQDELIILRESKRTMRSTFGTLAEDLNVKIKKVKKELKTNIIKNQSHVTKNKNN